MFLNYKINVNERKTYKNKYNKAMLSQNKIYVLD